MGAMTTRGATADVGLIGLAVMGQNLALNMADHGYRVAVYNRTTATMEQFVGENRDTPGGLVGCPTLEGLVATLKKPRKIIILVKAGAAVDAVVEQLLQAGAEPADLVVDCGNSQWTDTIRRETQYALRCRFFGSGVSGGEVGARFGPSLMPGGHPDSWKHLEPIWQAIAAKVDPKSGEPLEDYAPGKPVVGGEPCTAYIGPNGAGHYVKMVHNGIEYIDMQLISEAYHLLRTLGGLGHDELSRVFAEWNRGELQSYLIQITADILQQRDPTSPRKFLLDAVLDTAAQKGTGKWTAINALDLGIPANAIAEAVFARCLSALKDERVAASRKLKGPASRFRGGRKALVEAVRQALYCSKVCAYAQGFQLMAQAQTEYGWTLDFATIASIWPRVTASPRRPSAAPSPISTAIARRGCPPICCRRSATTSGPTPSSASMRPAARPSTSTGRTRAAPRSRCERARPPHPARSPTGGVGASTGSEKLKVEPRPGALDT